MAVAFKEWGLFHEHFISISLAHPAKEKTKASKQANYEHTHTKQCMNNGGQGDIFIRSNDRPIRLLP
jgi:hypothetical protein